MTLMFSAVIAGASMALNLPHSGLILTLVGYFDLLFLTSKFQNSSLGLAFVFALTGFMGYTLGLISVLLTGGIGLLELDPQWLAIKEAAIPGIIGIDEPDRSTTALFCIV